MIQDTRIFIGFVNFYRHFIQRFSNIAISLTSILKTFLTFSRSQLGKVAKKVNSEAKDKNRNGEMEFLAKSKSSVNISNNIRAIRTDFLTPNTKKAFNHLCQTFIETPIL